ncbi:MAG TPA: LysM peptidoglycan-binding domain-containing protein [Gemmatimonadales bacterium]|nr:LysM peptidoglycan-binding domain-containing protein [Gemmatimonadales bacterium]
MHRSGLFLLIASLAACSGHPAPATAPVPANAGPTAAAAAPAPSPSAGAVQVATGTTASTSIDADSLALDIVAADSAADAEALAALDLATPDSSPEPEFAHGGGADGLDVVTSWDIDVETYASHDRVQYYLDFFQGPGRERMAVWLTRLPRYEAMIREQLQANGVPEDMVYLALIESGFSNSAVSRARATGMWQFMKGTGRMYGLQVNTYVDDRRDPVKSTAAAARHLNDLQERFGSIYLAAAAYNAGAGKVSRGLRGLPAGTVSTASSADEAEDEEINNDAEFFRLYDTKYLRRETKDYVPKLIAAALIAKEPAKYGFEVPADVPPFSYDSIVVPTQTGLDVIARLSGASVAELRDLNPQYIRMVTPPGRSAVVRVPVGSGEQLAAAYAELPASKRIAYQTHVVRSGETISGIAKRYRVSTAEVRDANPKIPRSGMIRVGQQLIIPTNGLTPETRAAIAATQGSTHGPSRGATTYTVRRGDTLSGIARRYGISTSSLKRINGLSSDRLTVGQKLRLRGSGSAA